MKDTVIGAVAGGLFGLAVAAVGMVLTLRAMKKGGSRALAVAMALRLLLDLAALGAVYLLRNALPLPFEPTLIALATGLALGGILSALLLNRRIGEPGGKDREKNI